MPTGTLINLIDGNTASILLALVIVNVINTTVGIILWATVRDMKKGITWGDTCEKIHEEVDRRLERLERIQNSAT